MKRILLVRSTPNDLDISGYNVQQIGLGKAFVDLGYCFDFITFKKNKNACKEFVFYTNGECKATCIEKPRKRFFRWGINTDIAQKNYLDKYDIIICQEYYQIESYLISKKSKNVVLYSGPYYNMFMPKWLSPIYDWIIGPKLNRNVKQIFVKSKLAEDFLRLKGYEHIQNIGVALDTDRFEEETEIEKDTKKLISFMESNRCILYVGALSERKNYPFLLKTYQELLKHAPDVKFVIIGKSSVSALAKLTGTKDDEYANKYNSLLPKYVKDGIYHLERLPNSQLKYIYPLAKAFLLPSKLEIFGMVLLEAMFLKTPVITSRNGGSTTLIEGKETGQIINQFETSCWVKAILKYLNNQEYTTTVKENAHRLVKNEYNWNVLAKKILNHFEK